MLSASKMQRFKELPKIFSDALYMPRKPTHPQSCILLIMCTIFLYSYVCVCRVWGLLYPLGICVSLLLLLSAWFLVPHLCLFPNYCFLGLVPSPCNFNNS